MTRFATSSYATPRQQRTSYACDTNDVSSYGRYGSYERARHAVEIARRELEERRKHHTSNSSPTSSPYSFVTQAPRPNDAVTQAPRHSGPQHAVTQAPRPEITQRGGYHTPRAGYRRDEEASSPYAPITPPKSHAGWRERSGYHTPRTTSTQHRDTYTRHNDRYLSDYNMNDSSPARKSYATENVHRPLTTGPRKTLVIDLDETLVHSCFDPCVCDLRVPMIMDDVRYTAYVKKRPGCDEFLRKAAQFFDVIIWTASLDCYARPVIDELEREAGCGSLQRMYRETCSKFGGSFAKDLSTLGKPLEEVAIVDNTPSVAAKQPRNLIEVTSWYEDKSDRELVKLAEGFEHLANCESVYDVIRRRGVHY